MSGERLHAALLAAIEAHAPLRGRLAGVFGGPPVRAARPYAVVGDPVLADWSTKDMEGREARVAIELHDAGEVPGRLRALTGEVAAAVAVMPDALGGGWRVVTARLLRERIGRGKGEAWTASVEFRVRMLRGE